MAPLTAPAQRSCQLCKLGGGDTLAGLPLDVTTHFRWHRFLAIQIWVVALFLIYTFIHELNTLFGDGELYRILFTWRSTDLKLTRRLSI